MEKIKYFKGLSFVGGFKVKARKYCDQKEMQKSI